MTRLADIKAGQQQMTLDDYMALDRDASPPEATMTVKKGNPRAPAGVDPDPAGADHGQLETIKSVSGAKIGTDSHLDGDCPYVAQCESRRRKLSTYRENQPCHWRAFWQWRDCPIYRNGGRNEPGGNEH